MRRTGRLVAAGVAGGLVIALSGPGCGREMEMRDSVQISDTMDVVRAMEDAAAREALLDTMPGGEMARGDSAAEMDLLKKKM